MTLIDTNVLLDLVTDDPKWANRSVEQLDAAALKGPLVINDVVYAELSVRFATIEAVDALLEETGIALVAMPRAARTGVLPDFLIGAHATVMGMTLLCRDAQRYRAYYPKIDLVTP